MFNYLIDERTDDDVEVMLWVIEEIAEFLDLRTEFWREFSYSRDEICKKYGRFTIAPLKMIIYVRYPFARNELREKGRLTITGTRTEQNEFFMEIL